MAVAAPPGFLHIQIYITGAREADEPVVLEGYVTSDLRDPAPRAASPPPPSPSLAAPPLQPVDSSSSTAASSSSSTSPPYFDKKKFGQGDGEKQLEGPQRSSTKEERIAHGSLVELHSGRPDFDKIVDQELSQTAYEESVPFSSSS